MCGAIRLKFRHKFGQRRQWSEKRPWLKPLLGGILGGYLVGFRDTNAPAHGAGNLTLAWRARLQDSGDHPLRFF